MNEIERRTGNRRELTALESGLAQRVVALEEALRAAKRTHDTCEDCWYSCPKSGECCNDIAVTHNYCNCGADRHNARIDTALAKYQPTEKL